VCRTLRNQDWCSAISSTTLQWGQVFIILLQQAVGLHHIEASGVWDITETDADVNDSYIKPVRSSLKPVPLKSGIPQPHKRPGWDERKRSWKRKFRTDSKAHSVVGARLSRSSSLPFAFHFRHHSTEGVRLERRWLNPLGAGAAGTSQSGDVRLRWDWSNSGWGRLICGWTLMLLECPQSLDTQTTDGT